MTLLEEIRRPHRCELDSPDRAGIVIRCECGRIWRSVYPGNPAYAGWRRAGRLYLWLHGIKAAP